MRRLVQAEFVKLRSTQVWFWLLIIGMATTAGVTTGLMLEPPHNTYDVANAIGRTNLVCLTTFLLGILGITTEFRYLTITPTVLATPRRTRIVAAKLIAYLLIGVGFGVAFLTVSTAIALPWAAANHIPIGIDEPDIRRVLLCLPVVVILMTLIGIGVGALIRNQVAAVVLGLIFILVLQNIIAGIPGVKNAWPYTPSGAVNEMLFTGPDAAVDGVTQLPAWGGVVVLLLWGFIPAILGAGITMNRDIT